MVSPPQELKVTPGWTYMAGKEGLVGKEVLLSLKVPKLFPEGTKAYVDLVYVLDISGSMAWENKLLNMKATMEHIFKNWINKYHRVGVVTFSDTVDVLCQMTPMTSDKNKELVMSKVRNLAAARGTNIEIGLAEAVRLITDKKNPPGHVRAIVLLSDGDENKGKAANVPVENVRVETIGYGVKHNAKVLSDISVASRGGGYHSAAVNVDALATALSPALFASTRTIIRDLELTLQQEPAMSIDFDRDPSSKRKHETLHLATKIIHIGSLFSGQVFRVLVSWPQTGTVNAMKAKWTYKSYISNEQEPVNMASEPMVISPTAPVPTRTRALVIPVEKKILTERTRLNHVTAIKEAKELADAGRLEDAIEKLGDGMSTLDGVRGLPDAEVCKKTINFMYTELEELMARMDTQVMYTQEGLPYALTCVSSHDRQCPMARTSTSTVRLFCTPLMEEYLDKAIAFDQNRASTA